MTSTTVLTIEAVNAFIDRFWITEANFLDTTPHSYRYEQVSHWGLDANALMEPWEWEAALKRQASEDAKAAHEVATGLHEVPEEG